MVVGDIVTGTEVLVIGGGPGGYNAAARLGEAGLEVTLIEAEAVGGVCLNRGCIPSKALIRAAAAAHTVATAGALGIGARLDGVDLARTMAWKDEIVGKLRKGVDGLLSHAQVAVVQGTAHFTAPDRVSVENSHGTQTFKFKHCIIATGSRPATLPGLAPDSDKIIDSTGALSLQAVPGELVVVGGGYIGLELGTAYAKLGAKVTVLEYLDRLLPGMDADLARIVERSLKALGVTVHTGARVTGWEAVKGKAVVRAEVGGKELTVAADKVLVATGRLPNSGDLALAQARVETDARGFIKTDARCRTTAPHIYAIGDVALGPMLAHKASKEAAVVAGVITGKAAVMEPACIPAVVFTDPEVASAGLTEAEAKERGYDPVSTRLPFSALGRAHIFGGTDGLVKVVADRTDGRVLGIHMVGPEVGELAAGAALAIEMGARVEDLALTVHPHPTLSEGVMDAAERLLKQLRAPARPAAATAARG